MGMFDDIIVSDELVPAPKGFVRVMDGTFQTKDLECGLLTYKIESERLWLCHSDDKAERKRDWELIGHHGDIVFYDFYKVPGEAKDPLVHFVARFSYGKLDYIKYRGWT